MKPPQSIPLRLLLGALLCSSCVAAFADPLPTSPTTPPTPSVVAPTKTPPLRLPTSTTSLNISFPDVPRGESVKLLDAKVSLKVKDASFLSALDAVLASAGTSCSVEARGVKSLKLSLDLKNAPAGPFLDGLAKAGGARLWVFPTKLLIAPEILLTKDEKKIAKLYGVLISKGTLPAGSTLGKTDKGLSLWDIANTKVSLDFNNTSWNDAWGSMAMQAGYDHGIVTRRSHDAVDNGIPSSSISASLQNANYGDVMAFVAHANGCELYILSGSNNFLVCAPDEIPSQYKGQAIPAFTPSSTHFNFGPNPNFDPSAKGS